MREVSRYEMIKTINEGGSPKNVIQIATDNISMVQAFMCYDNSDNLSIVEMDFEVSEDEHISDIFNKINQVKYDEDNAVYYDSSPYIPDCDIVVDFIQRNAVYIICEDITIGELRQKYMYEDEIYLYFDML